jgi:hypothetical protein
MAGVERQVHTAPGGFFSAASGGERLGMFQSPLPSAEDPE